MTQSLEANGEINLTTTDPSLKKMLFGFGWGIDKEASAHDIDLDASVFVLNEEGKVARDEDFVFYNNRTPEGLGVTHLGDNTEGEGDVEQVRIEMDAVPFTVARIAFSVSLHNGEERDQDLNVVSNLYMRLVNEETGEEVLRYTVPHPGPEELADKTALISGEFYRDGIEWKLKAMNELFKGELYAICKHYGVNV